MDADLFCVGKVMKKSQKNFLKLTVNADDEQSATDSVAETPGNHSPSLEWDNDDVAQTFYYTPIANRTRFNLDTIVESPLSPEQAARALPAGSPAEAPVRPTLRQPKLSAAALTLPLMNVSRTDDSDSSSNTSSSGKGSLASSPGVDREKKLRDIVDEARKSGLVHDLLELLLKATNAKRDSAYYED